MNAAKIGRNDPCHCGTGQKYKRCCAAKDAAAHAAELTAQAAAARALALEAEAAQAAAAEAGAASPEPAAVSDGPAKRPKRAPLPKTYRPNR